jgi:hypothetical protein
MKKCLVVTTIFIVFALLTACKDNTVTIQVTINPSAQSLLNTLTVIASTVEAIGGSATAYAATLTPTNTPLPPTEVPNEGEVKRLLMKAVEGDPAAAIGAKITISDVKFGPIGSQEHTELYVELNCEGTTNNTCPSTQAVIVVINGCKARKKIVDFVPTTTGILKITIFDPRSSPKVVEIDWPDVIAYIKGDVTAEIFNKLIRYDQ